MFFLSLLYLVDVQPNQLSAARPSSPFMKYSYYLSHHHILKTKKWTGAVCVLCLCFSSKKETRLLLNDYLVKDQTVYRIYYISLLYRLIENIEAKRPGLPIRKCYHHDVELPSYFDRESCLIIRYGRYLANCKFRVSEGVSIELTFVFLSVSFSNVLG